MNTISATRKIKNILKKCEEYNGEIDAQIASLNVQKEQKTRDSYDEIKNVVTDWAKDNARFSVGDIITSYNNVIMVRDIFSYFVRDGEKIRLQCDYVGEPLNESICVTIKDDGHTPIERVARVESVK